MFTEEEIKEIYLEKIEEICNVNFNREKLPGGVKVALMKLMEIDPEDINIASEKLNDMSQTFRSPQEVYDHISIILSPYTKPFTVGFKPRRDYSD